MSLRSDLGKVKGLGSAKHGSGHWLAQKFSAVALIPLVAWFVITVIQVALGDNQSFINTLSSPINVVMVILFIGTALYHGTLGIQVVIEDYVSCECSKVAMIFLSRVFSILTIVAVIVAAITFHVNHLHIKGNNTGLNIVDTETKAVEKVDL